MSDIVNVLQRVDNVEVAPPFNTYSKVVISIDDDTEASAGTSDTGRTLDLTNPLFGSSSVAQKTLNRLQGIQYQPYKADGAILDPAAELGDAIEANGVFGGIYTRDRLFSRLMKASVSAPHDEEINHEYQFETPVERKLKRQMGDVKAEFEIQATQIAAKVSQVGGTNSSFGWTLTSTAHTWYSGNKQVMKVNSSGLEVKGKITATSGYIGNGSQGFEITSTAIRNGMTSLTDTTHNGIYIGTNGIALGKGAFKVTTAGAVTATNLAITGGSIRIGSNFSVSSSGNVSANNMTLTGTLTVGGSTITAADLRLGAQRANGGYNNWNSAYSSTSAGGYCYGGAGAGYSARSTWDDAQGSTGVGFMRVGTLYLSSLQLNGNRVVLNTEAWYDQEGNFHRIYYWGI